MTLDDDPNLGFARKVNSFPIPYTPKIMREITAREFKQSIKSDPAWAAKLTEPVEITDYCDMEGSKITHLPQLLHFTKRNHKGFAATFDGCNHLKVAEGKFAGWVDFSRSGVEKIGDLKISAPDKEGYAASFCECYALKTAEGCYPGYVDFSNSGIKRIGTLHITASEDGFAADFFGCKTLEMAEGTFPGHVDFEDSGIKLVGKLAITAPNNDGIKANFLGCDVRLPAEFLGLEYEMEDALRQKNLQRIAASKALKASPEIEI
ncbi:MAG: hypothetical protein WCK77_13525 [Verrucomicrobiota bacterium]